MESLIIDKKGNQSFRRLWNDLLRYKDLLWILAWRDYKVRYAQSALGVVWAFVQPLATLIILVVVFERIAKIDTGDVPYPVFAQTGMVGWTYFAFLLSQAGTSIIGAESMIKKIYFPRLIVPLSKAIVGLIDFGVSLILLLGLMIYFGYWPQINLLFLPFFLLLALIAGVGIGLWVSALTVKYRDVKHLIPFVVQLGLYATPVAYPVSKVPNEYLFWYYLNPMVGVIEGFRWSLLGGNAPGSIIFLSITLVFLMFFSGVWYFNRMERVMADIV